MIEPWCRPTCWLTRLNPSNPWTIMNEVTATLRRFGFDREAREFRRRVQALGYLDDDDTTDLLALVDDYVTVY